MFDKPDKNKYEIFLVNNSSISYTSVTTNSGANLAQDENTPAEMNTGSKSYGELKPYSFIKLEDGDVDWLDDHIWSQLLLKNESEKVTKKFFEIGGLAFVMNYQDKKEEKIPVFKESGRVVETKTIK